MVCDGFFLQSLRKLDESFSGLFGFDADYQPDRITDDPEPDELPTDSGFMQRFGWVYNVKQIADHHNITVNEAWLMSTIEALNTLAFLKSFTQYQKELTENARSKHR